MMINYFNCKSFILFFLLLFLPINNAFSSNLDELFYQLKNAENPNLAKEYENKNLGGRAATKSLDSHLGNWL